MSCDIFGGYTCTVAVGDADTVSDIVQDVLAHLEQTLRLNGFEALVSKLRDKRARYHIHDVSIVDILMGSQETFYVCDNAACSKP